MNDTSAAFENKKLINFLIDKQYRYVRHAIMLISLMLILFNAKLMDDYGGDYEYYSLLIYYSAIIFLIYVNIYLLVPLFFFRGRYVGYILVLMILLGFSMSILLMLMDSYFEPHRILERRYSMSMARTIISGVIFFVPFILVSTTIKLVQRWIKDNERINELKNITLKMELNGLKNQISPHFLFNMLNNVNTLVKVDPQKASLVILKLSDFLRYQLYDNDGEYTSLNAEVVLLANFLNLEKIRRDHFSFEINLSGMAVSSIFLPPNLFITFVENAVKHSADVTGGASYVHVEVLAEERRLHFKCTNSLANNEHQGPPTKKGGVGLANVKRRLELLYPDGYLLTTEATFKEYIVNLIIPI